MNHILAYADASTTALILQILAGVLVTLGAVFAIWWRKIVTFFKAVRVKLFGNKTNENNCTNEIDEELEDIVSDESTCETTDYAVQIASQSDNSIS